MKCLTKHGRFPIKNAPWGISEGYTVTIIYDITMPDTVDDLVHRKVRLTGLQTQIAEIGNNIREVR